jgi:glycosyltransferase involved in cell wall biosynthesis
MPPSERPDHRPARRVLLVSQRPIDYGGGGSVRWRYLSQALPAFGWEVAAITARANPTADEASTDPRRARLAHLRARVMNAVGDAARPAFRRLGVQPEAAAPNLLWTLTGRRSIAQAIDRYAPDAVWATAPPQSAIFAAVRVARRHRTPVVAELRDLWAGNPYFDAGGQWLSRIESPFLRGADAVVTVTPGCRETLLRLHPELAGQLHLLPNGFDPMLLALRDVSPAPPATRRATLIHAGLLYGDRSAAALVRALARTGLTDRVRLVLLGAVDVATSEAIQEAPTELEVAVQSPVGWRDAIERVRAADVAVVINSARTGGAMALPSKLYEALALGTPVLALTPAGSDTERLLRALGQDAGVAAPHDERAIAAALIRLLEDPPPMVSPQLLSPYDRDVVARQIAGLLDELTFAEGRKSPRIVRG